MIKRTRYNQDGLINVVLNAVDMKDTFLTFTDCSSLRISGSKFTNCVIRLERCHTVYIFENVFDQCVASHFIQTVPTGEPCTKLVVASNVFIANGQPFCKRGGKVVDNGASGDVISIRNVRGFAVHDNDIQGGGEIGITVLHGASDGVVASNMINGNDATGIQIGSIGDGKVKRVSVCNNVLLNCGLDKDGSAKNQAGFKVQNVEDVAISYNEVDQAGRSLAYGATLQQCERLSLVGNKLAVNKRLRIPKADLSTVVGLFTDEIVRH